MKTREFLYITGLLLLSVLNSCKHSQNEAAPSKSNGIKYASHLKLDKAGDYTIIEVREPWAKAGNYKYVAGKNKKNLPDSLKKYPFIQTPAKKIVVTSTTHLPHISLLGKEDNLAGFPNTRYISSEKFRKRVEEGKIKEIGNGAGLNTEETLILNPGLIIAFSSGNDQKQYEIFEKKGIPVIYNADWMENDPLGRAEWLKLFGVIFNEEEKAGKIFDTIARNYNRIKEKIGNKTRKPLVFQGGFFGDKWYVPGGKSYAAKLIEDAGGKYVWEKDHHSGSNAYSFENVLLKLPQADIWLNPGSIVSKSALGNQIPQAKKFKSYKNDRIYTYVLAKGKNGGLIYFEESPAHPDRVLEDLYHIFYPDESPQHKFHYYSILLP